jgi:hypothetical protein
VKAEKRGILILFVALSLSSIDAPTTFVQNLRASSIIEPSVWL